ncbi:hypothetical protein GOP47_0023222 [Adiantum capillus-veneris]|uniref:Protein TIC 22-like, chloroplastic n=1 Tax=Adiantum capillus-veneris TaxID=13818 RepID=A0A9D4U733_ADICA|nr:hypothetical protein GOP47_0023222 [Adiantum capillus-veneris]
MHGRLSCTTRREGNLLEQWKSQVENCIAAATQNFQQNPFLENISKWPSSFLQRATSTNAGVSVKRLISHHRQNLPLACLSTYQSNPPTDSKHLIDFALNSDDISQRLEGIPVYAVCNNSSEFVLVSDSSNQKSLGFFCFRRKDAESLLQQVQAREPVTGKGAKVVAVSLNKVYKLHAEGISFRFLPDPEQVKNALQVAQGFEEKVRSFDGVPVFQSNNLIVRSNEVRCSPVFFRKEDLEQALQTAFQLQKRINPSMQVKTDIQVGSLEHVLKQMEASINEQEWGDIVFIPPGMKALSQLDNVNKTTIG